MGIEIATAEEIGALTREVGALKETVASLVREIEAQRRSAMPEWLTVKEAAAHLRLNADTVRRRVRNGEFETRREGGRIRIARASVLD